MVAGIFFIAKFPNLWYTINKIMKGGVTYGKQCTKGNGTY